MFKNKRTTVVKNQSTSKYYMTDRLIRLKNHENNYDKVTKKKNIFFKIILNLVTTKIK